MNSSKILKAIALLAVAIIFNVKAQDTTPSEDSGHHHSSHVSKINLLNRAKLLVDVTYKANLFVHVLSDECYQCYPNLFCKLHDFENCTGYVDTRWGINLTVSHQKNISQSSVLCSVHEHFLAYGTYSLKISEKDNVVECKLKNDKAPQNIYIGKKGFFNGLIIFWKTTTYSSLSESQDRLRDSSSSIEESTVPIKVKKRLHSLDTFRGLSLTIMIFVNYGGGGYWFFKHSPWNGLTVADLVFPWFMWIMGVSMIFSLKGLLRRCLPRWVILMKIFRRSFILFSLGIILNSTKSNNLQTLRIPGVLQRFSISYLVVSCTELFFIKAGDVTQQKWYSIGESLRDKMKYFLEWFIISIFPLTHLLFTFLLHVPGCPDGYLGPGGKNLGKNLENCTGGGAGYIDRVVLGNHHLYQSPTCKNIYDTVIPYDPEGILGCLTSIFLVFLGTKCKARLRVNGDTVFGRFKDHTHAPDIGPPEAGKILIMHQNKKLITAWWLYWGVITGIAAGALCKFSTNDGWIPINKNLWSLSFVLCMASFAFFLLAALYVIIDVKFWWSGSPFVYPGMNSILVYVGSEITGSLFPWSWHTGNSHWEYLFCNVWGASLWVIISVYLYLHRFFLSI
ncbi:Heparan-alpha-glucosaminide N-acetyltransferase [Nymphon striatum]|nr:Heparan-alpha-glucosaminide N-acetyltransferase [Nymphon striatum]